jgi:hypothetical protein
MTDKQLKKVVKETLEWANDMSDTWVGTTTGNIIDSQKKHLENLVESGDMNLASVQVIELAQTLVYAEKELDEY